MFKKRLKDYFIPHEENNFAPHGLQKVAMVGMLFLVVLSFTATNALSLIWMSSQWMVSSILPAVIVELTNEERDEDNLVTLQRNVVLDEAATLKAQDMAKDEYFAHYSPEGVSPWFWFGEVQYNFVHAGENLAIHFTDSSDVVEAWMDSPTHRANIMNGNFTEIGVGTAKGSYQGFETVYVVQLFGAPAQAPATQPVVPIVAGETVDSDNEQEEDTEVLAEAVAITENVEVVEAEPVPVEVEEVVITPTIATTSEEIVGTPVADMEINEQAVVMYSSFISTSTNLIPSTIDSAQQTHNESTPLFFELATQPHKILQMLYMAIGGFVFISLLLSILIEIRRQQPLQIGYGVGLLSLMFVLFYVHLVLSSGASVV